LRGSHARQRIDGISHCVGTNAKFLLRRHRSLGQQCGIENHIDVIFAECIC
jgi:hypothetical protein